MLNDQRTDRKIRVLIVNTKFGGGGAEKIARQLYYGLNNYDIETFFFEGFHSNDSPINMYSYRLNGISKLVSKIDKIITNNSRVSYPTTIKILNQIISEYDIDIIHLNNIHGGYFGIKDIPLLSQRCKVVWTLHDMWAMTGHCAHSISCDEWKVSGCNRCDQLHLYPRILFDNAKKNLALKIDTYKKSDITFVTPSKWLANCIKESRIGIQRVRVINNGVNTNEFKALNRTELRKKNGYKDSDIIIFCAANNINSEYKGLPILISALQSLAFKEDYIVIFAGKLKKDIYIDGLRIIQTGYIGSIEKINEFYSMATVTVVPSVAETFPCVILESLASGTPVIANDSCGMTEMIDESTGKLFYKNDSDKLREELEKIRMQNLFDQLRDKCRKKAEDCYSEEKMLNEYSILYHEIMGVRRG